MPVKILNSFDRWVYAQSQADAAAVAWQRGSDHPARIGGPQRAPLLLDMRQKQAHADDLFRAFTADDPFTFPGDLH